MTLKASIHAGFSGFSGTTKDWRQRLLARPGWHRGHRLLMLVTQNELASWRSAALDALAGRSCTGQAVVLHMVRLAGIEPTTLGFGGRYSIH